MSIIYRYLSSHWYETLRDAEFLASSPNKFNDCLDCAGVAVGEFPREVVSEYFTQHDWFGAFSRIAQNSGASMDVVTEALNSNHFNVDTLNLSRRVSSLLTNRESLSKVWRIVCFSRPSENQCENRNTERRMWKRYADKNRGVRIGVDFSYLTRPKDEYLIHDVFYSDAPAIIDLSESSTTSLSHLDFLRIMFTKIRSIWGRENEVRLVTSPRFCSVRNSMCFWKFNREIVRQVYLGYRFPTKQLNGLLRMLSMHYPKELEIYRMLKDDTIAAYQYTRIG